MLRFLSLLIALPFFVAFISLMFVNRQIVTLNFNPMQVGDPSFSLETPLYIVAIAFMMVGVLLGAFIDWVKQGKYRKELRSTKKQYHKLSKQSEQLKEQITKQARIAIQDKKSV